MDSNLPDENVIREYLLGTLPEQDWDEIEEKLLSDQDFADFVDSIEDEIIEEYLAIKNHFLRPPERQKKLLFASVLQSGLKKNDQGPVSIDDPARQKPARPTRHIDWTPWMLAAAILILLTTPLGVYTANLYSAVKNAKAESHRAESQLAQAGTQVMTLQSELENRTIADVKISATQRDISNPPEFTAKAATKSILVYVELGSSKPSLYRVELEVRHGAENKAVWTADNLQPTEPRTLVLVIPYDGPGRYSLKVTPNGQPAASAITYPFEVVQATNPESQH